MNLQTQILQVFVDNLKLNGSFIDESDIAKIIFGNGYAKKTAGILEKMVKERMGQVRELADENGYLIIPRRKPTKATENEENPKRFKILGWKIPVKGFDDEYVNDELMYKYQNGQARTESFKKLLNKAQSKGMITGEKIKELAE